MARRSITDEEIGLIKAMLARGMANKAIQFYFNRQDRAVNSGRISGIKHRDYGPEVPKATDEALSTFLDNFTSPELSAPGIVVEAVTAKQLDPMDERVLRSFFAKDANGAWHCVAEETHEFECKENFNLRGFGKPLRTIAGFANNGGGYLFFGVKDKPVGFAVCGLSDDRFTETDRNKFSQTIRSALEPTPHFRVGTVKLDTLTVGIIHVDPHKSKPVIAGKTEGELIEGSIYYRYPGETRLISYSDLRAILDERDQRSREAILPMVQKLLELGPKDAMVANLAEGQLEGGQRPILIEPQSLEQIKFIREGEFDEVEGAPTLRVIGDAETIPVALSGDIRTIREEVTVDAIVRNFILRATVEQPLSYFKQTSHENAFILPIFYYLHIAGQTRRGAINTLKSNKNAKPKTRDELIKLLQGKRSTYIKLGGDRLDTFNLITSGNLSSVSTEDSAIAVSNSLAGMTEHDAQFYDRFHELLDQCRQVWEAGSGNATLLSNIRRACARLDELEFGPLVPVE
jgi:hypothetical protein